MKYYAYTRVMNLNLIGQVDPVDMSPRTTPASQLETLEGTAAPMPWGAGVARCRKDRDG